MIMYLLGLRSIGPPLHGLLSVFLRRKSRLYRDQRSIVPSLKRLTTKRTDRADRRMICFFRTELSIFHLLSGFYARIHYRLPPKISPYLSYREDNNQPAMPAKLKSAPFYKAKNIPPQILLHCRLCQYPLRIFPFRSCPTIQ